MSGGAGYVLSKEALRRFVLDGLTNSEICKGSPHGVEDGEIGKCMEKLNVPAGDTRDSRGRGRFFPFVPAHFLFPNFIKKDNWFNKYTFYPFQIVSPKTLTIGLNTPLFKILFLSRA